MTSSSCDSEEEICWWRTKNLIKERMIDGSLIHKLKRTRKLQKESKRINISLHNYVKRKLLERRKSLNSSSKDKNIVAHDICIQTDSESSGVDDVFMINSLPPTFAKSCNNHSATSKHSSNKANAKSKTKAKKKVRAYSKDTKRTKKQKSPPKETNENYNHNRSTNTTRILKSMKKRSRVSSLTCENQGDTTLSRELNDPLSDTPSVTPPMNKLNGALNGENDKNNLTNSTEKIKDTMNSVKLNIISEEVTDPIRRLPKGPDTIKKNLFNTVKNAESDVHESQDIISCDSEIFVNQNENESNTSSKLYEYPSTFNSETTRLSRNDTLLPDDIESLSVHTSRNFTDDSKMGSVLSNKLMKHDDALVKNEKTITAMNTGKTEEGTKNDSVVTRNPEAENSTLDNNSDIKIKETDILNKSNNSEDITGVIKRLPDNDSIKGGSFHEDKNIKEDSDLRIKTSNTSDRDNLPEKLNSDMKFEEKNAEGSKAEWLNDVKNSVLISKNVSQNSLEERTSPTHSLSLSKCESISGDDSVRTRFVPKVKSNKILNTRYKIIKLHEESKDLSFAHPLMTSSPNVKSLYRKDNTVDEVSKKTDKQLKNSKSTMKTQNNRNVPDRIDENYLEERNDSDTAIKINVPNKIHDSYKENSECSSLKGTEHLTYPNTPNSRKMLHKKGSHIEHEEDRTEQKNSSSLTKANEIVSSKEINNDLNLLPTHSSNDNTIISSSVTEIQSLRCVMQTLNTRKEKYNVDAMKEYEDQFLKKREEQSPSKTINTVHNKRPLKIQDLVAQSNFTEESSVASLTMNDISDDDEIFIFEIPKTVDVHSFRDKTFVFQGDDEIVIGGKKFEVYEKENRSVSIVLNKGDLKKSYGAVNLKAVRSVYIRPKILNEEIEVRRMFKEVEVPRSSTVPFPKNLRSRHPLLGCNVVPKKIDVSEENEETGLASIKILKWLASEDQYDDEDPVTNEQGTDVRAKPRNEIADQENEVVAMRVEECDDVLVSPRKKPRLRSTRDKYKFKDSEVQCKFMEDEEAKEETYIKGSTGKKRNIVLSDTFDETVTTNDATSSIDSKFKRKMSKKKKYEAIDKPKWDNEPDSKTLMRNLSMSCAVSDGDIGKKKLNDSLDFSRDGIISVEGRAKFLKNITKMKLDYKLEAHGKQSRVGTEVTKHKVDDRFGLEASEESNKRKIRKRKKCKTNDIKGLDDFTESQEYVSSPGWINKDILSSGSRAREEQRKRSDKKKLSFLKKIERKIQMDKTVASKSGVEKFNVSIESSQQEDQSCGSRGSKKKKRRRVCPKDALQLSYSPTEKPTLSLKRRCHSFSKFETDFKSKSNIRKRKKSNLNLTDGDDSEKEDKFLNLEKFIDTHVRQVLKKYKDRKL